MEASTGRVGVDKFPIDDEDDHLGSMWQADETATRTCYRAFWWVSFALSVACLCWEVLVLQDLHGISSTPIFGIVATACHLLIMIYGDWAMNRQREGHVYFFTVLLLTVSFALAIISCFAVASLERALRAVSERWPELDAITPRFTTSIGYKENFKQNEIILSVLLLAAALSSIPTLYRAKLQLGGMVRLAQARFAMVMPPLGLLLLLCAMAIAASARAFAVAAYALRPKEHNYLLTTLVTSAVVSLFSFIDVACLFRWGVHPATHTLGLSLQLPCAVALLVTSIFVLHAAKGVQEGMEEHWQDIQPLVGHAYSWRSPQRYGVDCTFLLLQAGISGLFGGVAGVLVCFAHFWSILTLIAISDSPPSVADGPIDSVFTMVGLEEDATYCERLPRNMRHGGQIITRGAPFDLATERSQSSGSVSSTTSSQLRAGGDLRVPSRPILGVEDLPLPPYSICFKVAGSAVWRALATTPRLFLVFGSVVLLFAAAWLIASVNLLVSNGRCAALVGTYSARSGFYESNVSRVITANQLEQNVEIDITNTYPRGLLELQVVEDGVEIEIRGTMRTLDKDRLLEQSRFSENIRPVPLGPDTTVVTGVFGPAADWEVVEANKHCDMLRLVVVLPRRMAQQFRLRLTSHAAPVQVDVNSTASSLAEVVVNTDSAPVTLRNLAIVGDPRVGGAPVINITSDSGPVLLSAVLAPGISVRTASAPVQLLSVLSGFLATSAELEGRRLAADGPMAELDDYPTMPVPELLAMMMARGHGDSDGVRMLGQLATELPSQRRVLQVGASGSLQAASHEGGSELPVASQPWALPRLAMHVAVAGDLYLEASDVGGSIILSQAIAGQCIVASAGSDVVIQNAVATVVGDTAVTAEKGRVLITNLLTVAGNRTLVAAGDSVIISTIQANWLQVENFQGPIRLTDLSLGVPANKLLSGPTLNYTTPGISVFGNHDVTVLSVGASTAAITAGSNDFAGVLQCVIQGGSHPVLVEVDGGGFRGTYNVSSSDQARVLVEINGQQQSSQSGEIGYEIPNAGQRTDSKIFVASTSGLIEFAVVSSPFSYV